MNKKTANKKDFTVVIVMLFFIVVVISYPAPMFHLYNWYTQSEPFRLLTDDERRNPEIFYLSPHTVTGDVVTIKETEQRTGIIDDLSDIPVLFPQLKWTPINEDYEIGGVAFSGKNSPYIQYSNRSGSLFEGSSWEGSMTMGTFVNAKKRREVYNQFVAYYANEFYKRGWDWSVDIEDKDIRISTSASGVSRTFVSRSWGYVAHKDGMMRFVSFRFDKNKRHFTIFLSDEIPLAEILKPVDIK